MKTQRLLLGLLLLAVSAAQAQFTYVTNNGIAIITAYTGPGGAVTIPSTLGGLPVTVLESSGFENKGITSISIPDTVTNIGVQEFAPNDLLTNFTVDPANPAYSSAGGVLYDKTGATLFEYPPGISGPFSIPTNVTTVGQNAFAACYYLSGVTIPPSVTNIEATGFGYCFALTNISIPTNVINIGPDAFINCYNLPAINVASGNPAYVSVGGVLFDKAMTTLLEYPTALTGNYTIPGGVQVIGTNAFILCNGLTGATMPGSVKNITDGAFADCGGLTNVTLGTGLSSLASTAFAGCGKLVAINIPAGNTNFTSLNGVVFNQNQTTLILFPPGFTNGYTVPSTVTSIADSAFEDCALTDVIISGNVASIGLDSFQGCGSLTNVTMSNGVSSLGIFAFADSPKLATVTIPATVTYLPFGVFAYDGLTAIYFDGNAPTSDPQAFLGETGTIYYMPGTSGWPPTFDGLTTALEGAPNPNGALQVTILPPGAVASGAQWQVDGGFLQPSGAIVQGLSVGPHNVSFTTVTGWSAPSNETVSISAGTTNSNSGTYTETAAPASDFTFVTNNGNITITGYVGPGGAVLIPSNINSLPVSSIGMSAFSAVGTLTSVVIPDTLTNLGSDAFVSCAALQSVTISSGVTSLTSGLFQDCFALSNVIIRGVINNIGDFALASCPALVNFSIPATVTNIGQWAFFGDGITNVQLPASLATVGVGSFLYCFSLPAINVDPVNTNFSSAGGVLFNKSGTELVEYPDGIPATSYIIPTNVTTIADSAFEYSVLVNVTLPPGLVSIGNYSFDNCTDLAGIAFPNGLASIGSDAFALCPALPGVTLPDSVTSLGQSPFAGCSSMAAINVTAGNPDFSSAGGVLFNKSGTLLVEFPGGPGGTFTVPGGVQDIGVLAFSGCQIAGVVIPPGVTNIEIDGFVNCIDLTAVTFSPGLRAIGPAAFANCYALTSIAFPPTLLSIGASAFSSCSALAAAIIPSSVTSIGDYAFGFCAALGTAWFEGNAPPDDGTVFFNDGHPKVYYLPGATGWGPTFGTAPTFELPGIALTAAPTNGVVPLLVNFTAASVDGATNPVNNWNWNFGDGATSTAQNPAHTYATAGAFAASVVETNNLGAPIAGEVQSILVMPVIIYSGLVANAGFETGDFTDWNLFGGDPADNFVTSAAGVVTPHSGNYLAALGSSGPVLSDLSQSLATTAGGQYNLSLWLNSPDGQGPNEFLVSWNGITLFDETNIPPLGWTNLQFTVTAAGASTLLEFGFRDDPSFLGLDDINVYPLQPTLSGVSLSGSNLIIDGIDALAGQPYIVLTTTNLGLPVSQWTPLSTNIPATSGAFAFTLTNAYSASAPQRYFILQTQ